MAFDPNKRADIFVTVDGPTDEAPAASARPAVKTPPQPANDYQTEADLLRNNIAGIDFEGRALRAEAERFVIWCRYLGEGTASMTWGPTQQTYAADWRTKQRARAAKLKSDIERECQNPARIIESFFGEKNPGQYDAAVTKAACEELGI